MTEEESGGVGPAASHPGPGAPASTPHGPGSTASTSYRPIAIIKTGRTYAELSRQVGDYEDWIVRGLGLAPSAVEIMDVEANPRYPQAHHISGIVITGSHAMVTDDPRWMGPLAGWLRRMLQSEIPILGVCFGHQMLGYAVGGRVGPLPRGPEIGTVEVNVLPAGRRDPLFRDMPDRFLAHTTHAQGVLELPTGAVLLARTEEEPHAAFRLGSKAWGVQFHPEYDEPVMRRYVREQSQTLADLGRDPTLVEGAVRRAEAGPLLARFAEITRESR